MGWFDEQLRQRKQQDDDLFAEAFATTANAVLGHRFSFEDDVSTSEAPCAAYLYAHASPMPDDAPVIQTFMLLNLFP